MKKILFLLLLFSITCYGQGTITDQLNSKPTVVTTTTSLLTFARGNITTVKIQDLNRGGDFIYKATGYSVDNGIVFAALGGGYWVRQYYGNINAKWYGLVGDNTSRLLSTQFSSLTAAQTIYPFVTTLNCELDWVACQQAINIAKILNASVIFPAGNYKLGTNTLFFYHKTRILGEGIKKVYLYSSASNFFTADSSTVITDNIFDGFSIRADTNVVNQQGFYVRAYNNTAGTGGMWYGRFSNIEMTNLKGYGFKFNAEGTTNNYAYIHQFITFENVTVDYSKGVIQAYGFFEQVNFKLVTSNVTRNSIVFDLRKVYTVHFDVCTIQGSGSVGVKLDNSRNVTFSSCWWESLDHGVQTFGTGNNICKGITFNGNTYRNIKYKTIWTEATDALSITGDDFLTGAGSNIDPSTQVDIDLNNANTQEIIIEGNSHVNAYSTIPNSIKNMKKMTGTTSISSTTLTFTGNRFFEMTPTQGVIYSWINFNSMISTYQSFQLHIISENMIITNTGNIYLVGNGLDKLTIPGNSLLTFTYSTVLSKWVISSKSEYFKAFAEPNLSYWTVGTRVYNRLTSAWGIEGWVCTREGISTDLWAASTAQSLNSRRSPNTNNGFYYVATTAGTSGTTEPTWPTTIGATVTDGTVTWTNTGVSALWSKFGKLDVDKIKRRATTNANTTLISTDYLVSFTGALTGTHTVTLPDVTTCPLQTFIIKDETGLFASFNITVSPVTGTIDGAASVVMNTNYACLVVYNNGTNWFVLR